MLEIIIEVSAPGWAAQGVKEHLAMLLERYGDTRVVEVIDTVDRGAPPPCGGWAADAALPLSRDGAPT